MQTHRNWHSELYEAPLHAREEARSALISRCSSRAVERRHITLLCRSAPRGGALLCVALCARENACTHTVHIRMQYTHPNASGMYKEPRLPGCRRESHVVCSETHLHACMQALVKGPSPSRTNNIAIGPQAVVRKSHLHTSRAV